MKFGVGVVHKNEKEKEKLRKRRFCDLKRNSASRKTTVELSLPPSTPYVPKTGKKMAILPTALYKQIAFYCFLVSSTTPTLMLLAGRP